MTRYVRTFVAGVAGLIAIVVVGSQPVLGAAPGPGWLAVTSHSAVSQNAETALLTVTTQGDIPTRANRFIRSNLGAGFAWADLNTGKVFAMTIHPTLGVDSIQNPRGWHAHAVTLVGGASGSHDFCIKSVDTHPFVSFSIDDNHMRVHVNKADLPEPLQNLTAAAGFTIQPDSTCTSGLAVQLSTARNDA